LSTRRYVYMNERIREKVPSGPVIVVQTGKRLRHTNRAQLVHGDVVVGEVRFVKSGLKAAPRHRVRAFVELKPCLSVRFP
jgi:hypothetical protein